MIRKASGATWLTIPIVWLYLGPPAFRQSGRSALASLSGTFDAWNLLRLGWWMVGAAVALWVLLRHRHEIMRFLRGVPQLVFWTVLWLGALCASSLYSPSPLFSLANAGMMVLLVVTALALAVRISTGGIDSDAVIRSLFVFSLALIATVAVAYAIDPDLVSSVQRFGLRVMGGHVADFPPVAVVTSLVAAHLAVGARGVARTGYLIGMGVGVLSLLVAQTLTSYIGFGVGSILLAFMLFRAAGQRARLLAAGASLIIVAALPIVIPSAEAVIGESPLVIAFEYLQREESAWDTGSGRTAISGLIIDTVVRQPWGLGFAAGPRVLLQSSTAELAAQRVWASAIGNAHNMYLEVLAGSGFVGFIAWLGILVWVAITSLRIRGSSAAIVRVLIVVCLIEGMTNSQGVLPFFQTSVLLWLLVAIVAGSHSRERRAISEQRWV